MIGDATLGPRTIEDVVSFSSSGDNTVITGTVGKIIKVQQIFFVVSGATNIIFKSASTALSGTLTMLASGAFFMDYIHLPITCRVDEAFIINSSNAVTVGGIIWYIKSP